MVESEKSVKTAIKFISNFTGERSKLIDRFGSLPSWVKSAEVLDDDHSRWKIRRHGIGMYFKHISSGRSYDATNLDNKHEFNVYVLADHLGSIKKGDMHKMAKKSNMDYVSFWEKMILQLVQNGEVIECNSDYMLTSAR